MPPVLLKLQPLHKELGKRFALPMRMSAHAAGFDLAAAIDSALLLPVGARLRVGCGFAIELPPGVEAQIRPRSGLASKHGVTCLNAPGTLDADFRGEVGVLLINLGQHDYRIEPGSRIAQMVICALPATQLEIVTQLSQSERGQGGFGSTGS